MQETGVVFNIQHFTIHDGPGIRTELFMKGCPMHCLWCSNPEGLERRTQPGVYRKRCIGMKTCGMCLEACQTKTPLVFHRNRLLKIDYDKCIGCGTCSNACPSEAINMWGRSITLDEAMAEIVRDRGYYERSGGGVTVSGGEPLLQADFVAKLFEECNRQGIHTCCESGLCVKTEEVKKIIPYADLWIVDIKMMDSELHRKYTGCGNEKIFENLKLLAKTRGEVTRARDLIIRIPVIPGVNDNEENMELTADFILNELNGNIDSLQLMSFMRLGQEKYQSLDMPYEMAHRLKKMRFRRDRFQKRIEGFAEYFNGRGIHTTVGTREKEQC